MGEDGWEIKANKIVAENQRLKQAIEEAIEAREAMSFYGASGIRIDVKVITNTLDQIIGILQKAIKEE